MEYSYSHDGDFYSGRLSSPHAAAAKLFSLNPDLEVAYVGEIVDLPAHHFVDVNEILRSTSNEAFDACGEFSENWLSALFQNEQKKDDLRKLIGDWLQENYPPQFWVVKNVIIISKEEFESLGLFSDNQSLKDCSRLT